jgi:ATP-dependent Lhr-like helicase
VQSDSDLLNRLSPRARQPLHAFSRLTQIQRAAIPQLMTGLSGLITAPTAEGKTEAALVPLLHLSDVELWTGTPVVLWIAPTRALVNDLHRRLSETLGGHMRVGRRTGEYKDADAELLVTTPESLDSMLVRGRRTSGHQLGSVRGVVLDELHLLAEGARGAQLNILLARLRNVVDADFYRIALTATVANGEMVARRFLGNRAVVLSTGGGRALLVHRGQEGAIPEATPGTIDPLAGQLLRLSGSDSLIGERLLALRAHERLKAVVFVASRVRCDRLAAYLRAQFRGRAPVDVVAHHGSLSKEERESTERILSDTGESVVVATSTLEIGIDIGDVATVVLDGPPGSVSSLLQRIGRANRRQRVVQVMPFARSDAEACILASMLRAAMRGDLEPPASTCHYSVALQQVASWLRGSRNARIRTRQLAAAFECEFGDRAASIVDALKDGGWLKAAGEDFVGPTDALAEIMDNDRRLHSNIGSVADIPVVDDVTGEPIAWVPRQRPASRVVIAGKAFEAVRGDDEIRVRQASPSGEEDTVRYAARRLPLQRSALRHLALGLGLPECALVNLEGDWVHFGGALFARMLDVVGVHGTALASEADPRGSDDDLSERCRRAWRELETLFGFGPLQRLLPDGLREQAVVDSLPLDQFREWRAGFTHVQPSPEQSRIISSQPHR